MWTRWRHLLLSQDGNAAHTKTSRHVCSVLGFLSRSAYSLLNRGISESIGSRPRAGRHRFGGRVFLFVTAFRPALVPTQLSVLFLPEATQPCVKLIFHIHLVPWLRMCGVIPPNPCVFMTWYRCLYGRSINVCRRVRKIAKSTISFVMSGRPSAHMEQLGSHWTDFHENWHLNIFRKSIEKIQVSLKSDNNGYFRWRPI
jgi:hypothetical protein